MSMNKAQLISAVAEASGLSKVQAEKAINGTIEAISTELKNGGSLTLVNFGTFSVTDRSARVGKNPQTGAPINIAAKKVAKFKPGKSLAEAVNVVPAPKKGKAKK